MPSKSKFMRLSIPEVGPQASDFGQVAGELNNDLVAIDSHDHTLGKGLRVPSDGVNVNGDIPFNGFNVNSVKCINFKSYRVEPTGVPNNSIFVLNFAVVHKGVDGVVRNLEGTVPTQPIDPNVEFEDTLVYWGVGASQSTGSTSQISASAEALASFNIVGNRTSVDTNTLLMGSLIEIVGGSDAGFFHPWVAIKTVDASNTIRFFSNGIDHNDLWVRTSNQSYLINNVGYYLYVRLVPIKQSERLNLVIKGYK